MSAASAKLAKLDLDIKAAARTVDELTPVVGDPEAVWDEHGWFPSERRALALEIFAERRVNEVRELRGRVAAQRPDPNTARDGLDPTGAVRRCSGTPPG